MTPEASLQLSEPTFWIRFQGYVINALLVIIPGTSGHVRLTTYLARRVRDQLV